MTKTMGTSNKVCPGWKNVARMDEKLGERYSEDEIRAVLAGEKQHTPRRKDAVSTPTPKVNLLVDMKRFYGLEVNGYSIVYLPEEYRIGEFIDLQVIRTSRTSYRVTLIGRTPQKFIPVDGRAIAG